ncbi:MAG: cytochrome P450 [Halioglobus sp.]|nr:cytochrome P450 [Halioglobus sp.]
MPAIPMVSGAVEDGGHFLEFCDNPAQFLSRAYAEQGEVCQFDLNGLANVLLVGPRGHEAMFRAPDEMLSAAEAYQMMVPVFGEGIQYGAPPELERQQLKMQARGLRQDRMQLYAAVIAREVQDWLEGWGDEGELDIYDAFTRLTLKTSTHCLMGAEFRYTLTDEFADLYHELEHSVSPAALRDPGALGEVAARRDRARARLAELIDERIEQRRASGEEHPDMLQVYMDARYDDGRALSNEEITGMVIWFMFAGHHTSGNTSSWTAVELARHPALAEPIAAEVDALYRNNAELSRNALKEIPLLQAFIMETLRLHPPLVTLTRRAMVDFDYRGYRIDAGSNVMVSPYVAHRLPEYFPDPETFDPARPEPDDVFAFIPFGGGHRKCVGNAFAILQVKAIFCALLQRYRFDLVDPAESYRDIMPSLILRPSEPCLLRYRRRS